MQSDVFVLQAYHNPGMIVISKPQSSVISSAINESREKFLGAPNFEPGDDGWEASMLPLGNAAFLTKCFAWGAVVLLQEWSNAEQDDPGSVPALYSGGTEKLRTRLSEILRHSKIKKKCYSSSSNEITRKPPIKIIFIGGRLLIFR